MKVNLRELDPNPYRDLKQYPIDEKKVESLRASFRSTGYWGNILVRRKGNRYQIACGHHRFEAFKLDYPDQDIEVIVMELDDAAMLRVQGEDNLEVYARKNVRSTVETVRQAQAILLADPRLAERLDKSGRKGTPASRRTPGRVLILRILGGNFTPATVESCVYLIDNAAPEVIDNAPTLRHAVEIARAGDRKTQLQLLKVVIAGKPHESPEQPKPLPTAEVRKAVEEKKGNKGKKEKEEKGATAGHNESSVSGGKRRAVTGDFLLHMRGALEALQTQVVSAWPTLGPDEREEVAIHITKFNDYVENDFKGKCPGLPVRKVVTTVLLKPSRPISRGGRQV